MKNSLLALLLAASTIGAYAQADVKSEFLNNTRKFDAFTSRNNKALSEQVYKDLDIAMKQALQDTKAAVDKASGKDKKALQQKLSEEQKLYTELKTLSADVLGHRDAIKTKLTVFLYLL
jgi:hypothetical protein